MGSTCSRFMAKITRFKNEEDSNESDIDFLKESRNLPLTTSIQKLLGACINCAVFVVVGMAVKNIAGPAMVLSVILGAVVAMLNNLSMTELCTRSPTASSFYTILYKNVGEMFAFMVGWFRLLQNIFLIAIVGYSAGEFIKYLAEPYLGDVWSPATAGWTDVKLDTLVFTIGFIALITIILTAGLPNFIGYIMALCWTSVAVFMFMFLVILYHANTITWSLPTDFQPYHLGGTLQGVAITMFFFANLDKVVEQVPYMKLPNSMVLITLSVSLLIVLIYYLCSTIFVAVLLPIHALNDTATLPKAFAQTTFHSSKYILSSAAIIIFCLTAFESYFSAQKFFHVLGLDCLFYRRFMNGVNSKRVPVLSVLLLTSLSIPLFLWLPAEDMVQGYCISSIIISIIINCSTIVVQYKPDKYKNDEKSGGFPNWECTKTILIRFLLCFGYISHKRVLSRCGIQKDDVPTEQSSKIVNWGIVFYLPSCVCLSLAMFHGLPVIGWKRWIVLAALGLLLCSMFITLRVILIQPRKKSHFFQYDFLATFIPLLNIALLSILLISLQWLAFSAVGVWAGVGLIVYFIYGISHSQATTLHNPKEPEEKTGKGGVQFEKGPDLRTSVTSVQPQNKDVNSTDKFLYEDDSIDYDYPQRY